MGILLTTAIDISAKLLRFCKKKTRNDADAEDAVSHALEKAAECDPSWNGSEEAASSWLHKVAMNKCIDIIGDRHKMISSQEDYFPSCDEVDGLVVSRAPDIIKNCIKNDRHVRVIVLRLSGLSYKQIEDQLGYSPGSLKVTLHRIRNHIKQFDEDIA